jgi:membrane-bound lytic murein transglycosylase D
MKTYLSNFLYVMGIAACCTLVIAASNKTPINEILPQIVKSINMRNHTYTFADEPMPLNDDTRERLDRELTVNAYWHSATLLNIKLAQKYLPEIERILREEGVPDDFKYLAIAESGLRNVSSSAGAKGYWQFLQASGKEYGLEINSEVDERYHLEKSTRAACKYIKWLKNKFGNYTNAAAAYNVGPTRLASELVEQGEKSYYDLNLNEETSRYVFRLIAIKEILSRPQEFGFYSEFEDGYHANQDLMNIEVTQSVPSWADFAESHGLTYRMLKFYNPWIIDSKLTVKSNTYYVKVPRR